MAPSLTQQLFVSVYFIILFLFFFILIRRAKQLNRKLMSLPWSCCRRSPLQSVFWPNRTVLHFAFPDAVCHRSFQVAKVVQGKHHPVQLSFAASSPAVAVASTFVNVASERVDRVTAVSSGFGEPDKNHLSFRVLGHRETWLFLLHDQNIIQVLHHLFGQMCVTSR